MTIQAVDCTNEYNGWANYPTWNVDLWPMQDEGAYRYISENAPYTPIEAEEMFFQLYPEGTPDLPIKDYGRRLYEVEVDWEEIANAWNDL